MRQQMILTPHDGVLVIRFANYSYLPVLEKNQKINENCKKRCKNVTRQRQHHKGPLDEPKTVSNKCNEIVYDIEIVSSNMDFAVNLR